MHRKRKHDYEGDSDFEDEYDATHVPYASTAANAPVDRSTRTTHKRRKGKEQAGSDEEDPTFQPSGGSKQMNRRITRSAKRGHEHEANQSANVRQDSSAVAIGCSLNGVPGSTSDMIGIFRAAWGKRDSDATEWQHKHHTLLQEFEKVRAELVAAQAELEHERARNRALQAAMEEKEGQHETRRPGVTSCGSQTN